MSGFSGGNDLDSIASEESSGEDDNLVMHTMQMLSNARSEDRKLTLPAMLSWSAVIVVLTSLKVLPHHIAQ